MLVASGVGHRSDGSGKAGRNATLVLQLQARELLTKTLNNSDLSTRPADKIANRVLAAGYRPDLGSVKRKPFVTSDDVLIVGRGDQMFLASVDTEAKILLVQERRGEIRT